MNRTRHIWTILLAGILAGLGLALTAAPAWACGGDVICVDADAPGPTHDGLSWTTAYTNVQDALAVAEYEDEIWVAEGVYYPDEGAEQTNDDVDSTFALKGWMALYGGFAATETQRLERDWAAHVTVLSGDIDQNDTVNAYGVVTDTDNISGSNALHVVSSGGVNESARLDGFTITAGKANGNGGGIFITSGSSTLINLIIRGNAAQTAGGGMSNSTNCKPSLTNVVFANNTAQYGGGMNNNAAPVFTNVTFYGNQASIEGGGLRNWASSPTLVNCILWGNNAPTGPQIYNPDGGDPTITYSDVQGGYAGEGNIDADPLFVDAAGGNLRLSSTITSTSLAINAGSNSALPADLETDLDGNPRILDTTVDMGAYESLTGVWIEIHDPAHTPLDSAPISATFQIHAQITVLAGTSGLTPTGVVTFSRYADAGCSGAALTTDTLTLRDGLTETVPFSISEFFYRAAYSGDAHHSPKASACQWFNVYSFVYVDADATGAATGLNWTDAYTNVQDALAVAEYEDEIWVAEGVYYPDEGAGQMNDAITSIFVLTDGVSLYGGFAATETLRSERDWAAHVTVLSGDIDQNDGVDAYGVVTDTANINGSNALHVINSSIGVGDTTFLDGFSITAGDGGDENGGGMTNGGRPSLRRLVFSGNRAGWGGGLYNSGSPSISQVTFVNNQAIHTIYGGKGGGGMQNDGGAPTLTDVAFIGNEAPMFGGGLSNHVGSIWLFNVSFSNNTVDYGGGGICNYGMAVLNDLTFSNNTADYGGGIFFQSGPLLLDHGTFQGNHAQYGGGMYTSNDGSRSVTLHDVSFISNTAVWGGGLRSRSWRPLTLDNVFFIGNSATEGGGFHTRTSLYDDNHKLNGVQFISNHAQRGGGVYIERGIHTFTDVIFENNDADYGGGLYNARHLGSETSIGRPHLINTIFISNSAVYDGGGLYNTFGEPALENVTFTANSAQNGGGMYNTCGGLYTNPAAGVASLSNTHFISNSAVSGGGGLYNTDGTLLLAGARLTTNQAENGGGLYNTAGSTATLTNTLFFSNSATAMGGGLYNQDSIIALANGTLAANAATLGGALANSNGDASLVNGILWGNTAASYPQIYNLGGSVAVTYCDVQGGYAGTGNLDADPRFVDAASGDLRLGAGSPAVDAGNNLAVILPIDIVGNPRIVNGTVDMGAYEAQGGILTLHKAVTPTANVPYHSAVRYSLALRNVGAFSDSVTLTDTLPDDVLFGGWVVSPTGTLRHGQAITWSGTLSPGQGISLTFVATHTGDYGQVVTNTAWFSSPAQTGSAEAVFGVQAGYTLTVRTSGAGGGTVTSQPPGIACGADCAERYADGTLVSLTATPLLSATFGGWSGDVTTGTNPLSLTVDGPKTVTATFALQTYTITPTAGVGGEIVPGTPQSVTYGDAISFTIAPTTGYHIADVWVDGGSVGPVSAYTFESVTANHTLSAAFALDTYVITPTAGVGGEIVPGVPQTVTYGEAISFTIAPTTGYHIADVWVDGGSVGPVSAYTFESVTANHTLSAAFGLDEHTLAVGVVGQGTVTRVPSQTTYLYGEVVTLTAAPAAGWYFGQWSGDAGGTLPQITLTMNASKAVTATFVEAPPTYYTLTLSVVGSGTVTPSVGMHSYLSGTLVNLRASPDAGWRFEGWSGDLGGAANPATLAMDADKAVTATFVLTATNQPPAADAGGDQWAGLGDLVELDGRGSSDPDAGDSLTYHWAQTGGPAVVLSDRAVPTPTFTASATGTLAFALTVTDTGGLCDSDSTLVTVTAQPANQAPRFVSTPISTATVGVAYSYTVVAEDGDGDPLTLTLGTAPAWLGLVHEREGVPLGNGVALLTGTPPISGSFAIELYVTDGREDDRQRFDLDVEGRSGYRVFLPVVLRD